MTGDGNLGYHGVPGMWEAGMAKSNTETSIELYRLVDDGAIPNNEALPLIVYRAALPPDADPAGAFEALFARNGWSGGWRNGIYPYHHYHSTAHEVLGIAKGEARARFGGDKGETVAVRAGDVVVVPAGVGHKKESASADLLVIGAYPDGRGPDLCTGKSDERPRAIANIAKVSVPDADPVFGQTGPLINAWGARH
jgi:uncharacterized protein YjlB